MIEAALGGKSHDQSMRRQVREGLVPDAADLFRDAGGDGATC